MGLKVRSRVLEVGSLECEERNTKLEDQFKMLEVSYIGYLKYIYMAFKFEKLRIWQRAMELGEQINTLASSFPKKETYNLSSQIRRAADSVALNISEGSILQSNAEYRKFLGYSIRSLAEVVTYFHKANRRNYLENESFEQLYSNCYDLMNMIIAFRSKLQ